MKRAARVSNPNQIRCLADAFDLSTPTVHQWELDLIWAALDDQLVRFSDHAVQAAIDESIPQATIINIIRSSVSSSKDIATESNRKAGINFDGRGATGGWVRAKVSWFGKYLIVTVHRLER